MQEPDGLIGQVVAGRYRVTRLIGEGAMASVYHALQNAEPRELALKVMHPHLAATKNFVKRFRREAKAASQLDHANVVRVFDHGVDGDVVYMAMELLDGEQLSAHVKQLGRLPLAETVDIMRQICSALSAAHAQGIVHRDLKPQNILLLPGTGSRVVKVVDFGIAKLTQPQKSGPESLDKTAGSNSNLTTVGSAVGTPEYMSPEQCRGVSVDARSDLYTCGILLYQMVTGRLPFTSEVHVEIMLKHVREPPEAPSRLVPDIDPRLEQIIMRALSKSASIRPQTAQELAASLQRLLIPASPHGSSPNLLDSGPAMPAGMVAGVTTTPYPSVPPHAAPRPPMPSVPPQRASLASYGSIAPGPYAQAAPEPLDRSKHERLATITTVVVIFVAIFGLAIVLLMVL